MRTIFNCGSQKTVSNREKILIGVALIPLALLANKPVFCQFVRYWMAVLDALRNVRWKKTTFDCYLTDQK